MSLHALLARAEERQREAEQDVAECDAALEALKVSVAGRRKDVAFFKRIAVRARGLIESVNEGSEGQRKAIDLSAILASAADDGDAGPAAEDERSEPWHPRAPLAPVEEDEPEIEPPPAEEDEAPPEPEDRAAPPPPAAAPADSPRTKLLDLFTRAGAGSGERLFAKEDLQKRFGITAHRLEKELGALLNAGAIRFKKSLPGHITVEVVAAAEKAA